MRYCCLLFFVVFPCLAVCDDITSDSSVEGKREKKVFSLFSIVTFRNVGCTSNQSGRNGTCFTSTECTNKGGTSGGNCAAGFGVCCVFKVSAGGSSISQNCSYIQNPSFPSVYSATTGLTYTINKCSADVCSFRLDFDTFTILGPALTTEATDGHNCLDTLVVSSSATGLKTPTLCGQGTGQHVYVDVGETATSTATVTFTFSGTASTVRTWDIKVTQIPCSSQSRPPSGCMQYHTGLTGSFKTFNFINSAAPQHLASQRYSICVRREAGYCCISYAKCADANSFTLDITLAAAIASETDVLCTNDYIGIDGLSATCSQGTTNTAVTSKLCGTIFNPTPANAADVARICDCTTPFAVQIVTDAITEATAPTAILPSRGLCFDYMQIPCAIS